MSTKLQEAINATRDGNKVEAQRLLADLLKDDTNNVQAWYLLSLLVESEEKKRAYLGRVLALDPDHEKAKELLLSIDGRFVPEPELDLVEENAGFGSEHLPSWLEETAEESPEALLVEEDPSEIFNDALPSWLSTENSAMEIQDEPPTLLSESPPPELDDMLNAQTPELETAVAQSEYLEERETAVKPSPKPSNDSQIRWWNAMLTLLWILLFVVLAAFIILLLNAL